MKGFKGRKNSVKKRYGIKGKTMPQKNISFRTGNEIRDCSDKVRFNTEDEALKASIQYTEHRVLLLTPVGPYECIKHKCWHIGHRSNWTDNRERFE